MEKRFASQPLTESQDDRAEVVHPPNGARLRWPATFLTLAILGWVWPRESSSVSERLDDTGWVLGWLTILVLIGVAAGYLLRSRWSVPLTVLGLYTGGAVHWFQYEWGFLLPVWEDFLPASGLILGLLLLSTGLPAAVTCQVLEVESQRRGRSSGSIQLAAGIAGLSGLLAFTAINVLPVPYIGGFLGLAAVLAGITVMQEAKATGREHLLAISGMIFGVIAAGMQSWELWQIIRDL